MSFHVVSFGSHVEFTCDYYQQWSDLLSCGEGRDGGKIGDGSVHCMVHCMCLYSMYVYVHESLLCRTVTNAKCERGIRSLSVMRVSATPQTNKKAISKDSIFQHLKCASAALPLCEVLSRIGGVWLRLQLKK